MLKELAGEGVLLLGEVAVGDRDDVGAAGLLALYGAVYFQFWFSLFEFIYIVD